MSAEHARRVRLVIEALRSGQYQQAPGALRRGDRYCCLGVTCDVYRRDTGRGRWLAEKGDTDGTPFAPDGWAPGVREFSELPEEVAYWLLGDSAVTDPRVKRAAAHVYHPLHLSMLNDEGVTFAEIADLIEAQLLPQAEAAPDEAE